MYERLPHGPHKLERKQVSRHQRLRVHGAMIEAAAQYGYQATTVRHVIELAGVSRRSFYEQFANKEACFLATFDLIAGGAVQRMTRAYAAAAGGLEERMRAALNEFAEVACANRKAAALVLLEAHAAGPAAERRLRHAMAGSGELAEEMLRWTLAFQGAGAEGLAERLAARVARRPRDAPGARTGRQGPRAQGGDARERLLANVLRLAVFDDYGRLTEAQIADEAGVPLEVFVELFAGKGDCFLAALDALGEQLRAIAADPGLRGSDWPWAVRRALAELMRFLAEHPLYAQTIARAAFLAGPEAVARNLGLARDLAALLIAGAPGAAPSRLTVEGLAGAIWHTIRCQVAVERIQLLPALSDYLAYVALAPCIGAEASAQVVSADSGD